MASNDKATGTKGFLKKMFLGLVGLSVILAVLSWKTAVAVHDQHSNSGNFGNLSTFLDLLVKVLPDNGQRAEAANAKGDYQTARKLYQTRAEHGHTDAMLNLAVMETVGKGGPVDYLQALKWLRLVADRGDAGGQFGMGLAYEEGRGVQQNYAEAHRWYQKSARQGSLAARVNLGILYLNGQGVAPDLIEAQKWFILGGRTGQQNRASLDRRLTAEQKIQAKQRADDLATR